MQLKQEGVGFDANFKPESEDFDVADPTGLIIILRDRLYSDKLRVFIQEYISNARDANREVGRPDHEIEITAPTKSEPIFKVRDYGPGLSPERMRQVFIKFGASTKQGSDTFIGGFGIGAKSGWAYTDSFVVRSFHEGTEYHYLCHLGESPKGSMSKLLVAPTTEPNGVEIQVQIQQDDVNRSHVLLSFLTRFWPTLPKINNLKVAQPQMKQIPGLPFELIDSEASPYESKTNLPDIALVLDGIPYALKCEYLERLVWGLKSHSRSPAIVFRARTGEVDVAANREHIEINNKYKAWLTDKIQRTIAEYHIAHLEAAKAGLLSYIKFWDEHGRYTQLSRERGGSGGDIDFKKLQDQETGVMETNYGAVMRANKQAKSTLEELRFLIPPPTPQMPPITTKMNGFCWYFAKEKVTLVNETLLPIFLKETQVYMKCKAPMTYDQAGRRKVRKELYQLPFKIWEGKQAEKEVYNQGLPLKSFDERSEGTGEFLKTHWASCFLYNDEPKPAEKIAKLTSRIPSQYTHILEIVDVPDWFKTLGAKPLSKSIAAIVRYASVRVSRPSGSVREVSWNTSHGNVFGFGTYETPEQFRSEEFFEDAVVMYAWTDESRNKWGTILEPFVGRMTINDTKFLQLNKKAFKSLQEMYPKTPFTHWDTWAKTGQISSDNITQVEYEQFAFQWLDDTAHQVLNMLCENVSVGSIKHKEFKEFLEELGEAKVKRGGRYGNVGNYFQQNRKIVTDLKRSRIYQLRRTLLKKYPMLPIVEANMINHERNSRKEASRETIFNEFLHDPATYMRTKAKQHGDAETWLRSKE